MKRLLVIAFLVAACGSTVPPGTTPPAPSNGLASEAPALSEMAAASESIGPGVVGSEPGTLAVNVGGHGLGSGVTCQALGDGGLSVLVPLGDGEAFALVFRPDGTVSSLSGSIRGVVWKVTQNPQGTLNPDKSGTFSGKDAISGANVGGSFACK